MSEPVTDTRAGSAGDLVTGVSDLAAQFTSPDTDAGAAARRSLTPDVGRLGTVARWLAETRGAWPPPDPQRIRLVTVGAVSERIAAMAGEHEVQTRSVETPTGALDTPTAGWLAAGVAAADAAVDEGVDVVIVTGADTSGSAGVVVSLYTGAEPVALLPRGAAAIDTGAWIARAAYLRDHRRRVAVRRADADALLAEVGSGPLAAAAGCVGRATARRTPVLLDGTLAVTGALVCHELQPRAARWWQVADNGPDLAHTRAVEEFDLEPLLTTGLALDDGTAGLLCVPLLRAAARLVRSGPGDD